MNPHLQGISVITDIAANMFAVFLLIFLLLLAVRVDPAFAPATSRSETPLDVEKDLASVLRTPLRPEDMVDMLYERRGATPGTRIDLFADRVEMQTADATKQFTTGTFMPAASWAAAMHPPISVYVFDHRYYRAVLDALRAAGSPWRELSVPQALRGRDPATGRQAWSTGFLRLLDRRLDLTSFRTALANLLGSPQPGSDEDRGGAGFSYDASGLDGLPTTSPVETLRRWGRAALNGTAIFGGLLFVVLVERAGRSRADPASEQS